MISFGTIETPKMPDSVSKALSSYSDVKAQYDSMNTDLFDYKTKIMEYWVANMLHAKRRGEE
jgi:hypothetical protein